MFTKDGMPEILRDHRLKILPKEGKCKILASTQSSYLLYQANRVEKIMLPYLLLFINIHNGTKQPISVHQNRQLQT